MVKGSWLKERKHWQVEQVKLLTERRPLIRDGGNWKIMLSFYMMEPLKSKMVTHPSSKVGMITDGANQLHDGSSQVSDGNQTVKRDRKSTRLNSSHVAISYAVFCLKKK